MNLDELRSVQAKERRKDSLQHLRDAFYDDVAAYIADLRAARDRRAEQVEKPFSDDDVRRMSDEIETAEEVAEALYERRVGKVVKLASFAAADMPVETEGMTSQERQLFDDLVSRIGENKSAVLDVLAGESPPEPTETSDSTPPTESDPATSPTEPNPSETADPSARPSPDASQGDDGALAEAMGRSTTDGSQSTTDDGPTIGADASPATGDARPTNPNDMNAERAGESPAEGAGGTETDGTGTNTTETNATRTDGIGSSEPVAVDPEPAPPGAPGTDEDSTETSDRSEPEGEVTADRTTVRITADVGEIFGIDEREYDLAAEDVVTLPSANADPLVQRDAAERIE